MHFNFGMLALMAAALVAAAPTWEARPWGDLQNRKAWAEGAREMDNNAWRPTTPPQRDVDRATWRHPKLQSWGGHDGWFPACDASCNPQYNPNCIRCNSPIPPAPGCDPQCNPLYNKNCVRCYPENFDFPPVPCDQSCDPKYNPNCIRCNSPVQPAPGCDPQCNPLYNSNCVRCYPDWVR
ncbi:hypothetical protein MPH_06940 [Macrophomina phaseolina MS6]|uniref:Uncharacterized protein n=2 Tax=Macrophomina phaseolina TaxID=35725 RepID=K2RSZ1_MACPH|nr:hypothetical protein MPH_06940 [Macrophomina phaseolina MS6]KAH7051361.1 hypothetical protein B0J12DRAFT_785557 [Macrophomina phaseolina]